MSDSHPHKDKAPPTPHMDSSFHFGHGFTHIQPGGATERTCPLSECPHLRAGWLQQKPGAQALPVSQAFSERFIFVFSSRSCSEDHILITLRVEMSQQICGTVGARCLLPAEASWDPSTTSTLQGQDGLPGPHWGHSDFQFLSAEIVTLSKPCPVLAWMPGHILEAGSGESSSRESASSLTFGKQRNCLLRT